LDLSTGQPLGEPIQGDYSSITSIIFNPTNGNLALGSVNGSVILLNLNPESWIEVICQRAGRNFSSDEWKLYFNQEEYQTICPQWQTK
jgi:WD40 repeat protein